jgi:hypothetical protein
MLSHKSHIPRKRSDSNRKSQKQQKNNRKKNNKPKHKIPFRFLTWNVLSALPQHYDLLKAQPPKTDIRPSLRHNDTRYEHILEHLAPAIEDLRNGTLHAIALQEVDSPLLARIREQITSDEARTRPDETISVQFAIRPYIGGKHFRKMVDPKGNDPLHDFSYWLVTLVRLSDLRKDCHTTRPPSGRFLTTYLNHCNVTNVHLPWVSEKYANYEEKKQKSVRTFSNISRLFGERSREYHTRCLSNRPTFVIGDLNASSPLNTTLFDTFFPTSKNKYNRAVFGESYKIDPDHVQARKTFDGIPTHGQDDGVICEHYWTIEEIQTEAIGQKRLPVNNKGLFHNQDRPRQAWPSDHALVRFTIRSRN